MTDCITFDYNREELLALARERGFDSIQAYLEALIAGDRMANEEDDDDIEVVDIAEALRESLRDLREGRTYSVEEMWAMLDEEDDDA